MGSREDSIETQLAEAVWEQYIQDVYPEWNSRHYFVPAIYVNKTHNVVECLAGEDVEVPQAPVGAASPTARCKLHDSDVRNDVAQRRILHCLGELADSGGEAMFVVSQLEFGSYLGEPSYSAAAAAARLPRAADLVEHDRRGDFDFLILHRKYGILVAEVKAVGDNWNSLQLSEEEKSAAVSKKVKDAIKQLDKAERVLKHLVSDQQSPPRILKTLCLPGLAARSLKQVLENQQALENLSDPGTPWFVSPSVSSRFQQWWTHRLVDSGDDPNMTDNVYLKIVARFCGPATTVKMPWNSSARSSPRTWGEAVSFTGACFVRLTLLPEQVSVLHEAPPRLLACGPPGTGKTVVLLLQGREWLRQGHEVHVISSWKYSLAACYMLRHFLQLQPDKKAESKSQAPGQSKGLQRKAADKNKVQDSPAKADGTVSLHEYDFEKGMDEIQRAVRELTCCAKAGCLHVIADEAGPDGCNKFKVFCEELLEQVPPVRLWAARCRHDNTPEEWRIEYFTRPLRCPLFVQLEVEKSGKFSTGSVRPYAPCHSPSATEGLPVINLEHDDVKHGCSDLYECTQCGELLACLLRNDFHVSQNDVPEMTKPTRQNSGENFSYPGRPSNLRYQDVVLLYWALKIQDNSGLVNGLRNSGIPVKLAKSRDMENMATRQENVVWAVDGYCVQGLEWKIVVYCGTYGQFDSFCFPSRCLSQLVCLISQ